MRHFPPRCFPTFILLVAITFANAVCAADAKRDPDLPPIDPPGKWHLMTQDPATTESRCVGDPKTAMCAVETVIACFLREIHKLCRSATGMDEPSDALDSEQFPDISEKYRVLSRKRLRNKDLRYIDKDPEYLKDPEHASQAWKVDDIAIEVLEKNCWRVPLRCARGWDHATTYIARKVEDHWRVIDWHWPGPFEPPFYRL